MKIISGRPEIYALIAAAMNGSIGALTRVALAGGVSHHQIAFMKCFLAFILLLLFSIVRRGGWQAIVSLRGQWSRFMLLSFLGIFCLYYFETWAFDEASIPLVSFLTYAAGGITLCLSVLLLGERLDVSKILAFTAIVAGVYLIYAFEQGLTGSRLGMGLALLGGLGYALFLVTSKYLKVGSGIAHLVWLFGGGSILLLGPALHAGFTMPGWQAWTAIVALVLIPTIGGFYFTTRAVRYGEASKVQIIETSDPIFATTLGFFAFGDAMSGAGLLGAVFIFGGLLLAIRQSPRQSPRAAPPPENAYSE
jgi:drug/metabolite transporter (DMT)-like permease